jgi:hypothetical protein
LSACRNTKNGCTTNAADSPQNPTEKSWGCKTEFFESCDLVGIERLLLIGQYILLWNLLLTVAGGLGRTTLKPKA